MGNNEDPEVTNPRRIRQFAAFFKNYMGVSTFIVAALPIPVAQAKMIPMHPPDRNSTSVITSLMCFLLLAFIFYSRHRIGRILFPVSAVSAASPRGRRTKEEPGRLVKALSRTSFSLLILALIVASAGCFLYYQLTWFIEADHLAWYEGRRPDDRMTSTDYVSWIRTKLMASYTGFFVFAEAAFVLMATKEYLQELLGFSDNDLIRGRQTGTAVSTGSTPAEEVEVSSSGPAVSGT